MSTSTPDYGCFVCSGPHDTRTEALDQSSGYWRHTECDPRESCTAHGIPACSCLQRPTPIERKATSVEVAFRITEQPDPGGKTSDLRVDYRSNPSEGWSHLITCELLIDAAEACADELRHQFHQAQPEEVG